MQTLAEKRRRAVKLQGKGGMTLRGSVSYRMAKSSLRIRYYPGMITIHRASADCALGSPCAAAFCHHSCALASSFGIPSPI